MDGWLGKWMGFPRVFATSHLFFFFRCSYFLALFPFKASNMWRYVLLAHIRLAINRSERCSFRAVYVCTLRVLLGPVIPDLLC